MEKIEITADQRTGKTSFLRRSGQIPAVVYGKGMTSIPIQLDCAKFLKVFGKNFNKNAIISLVVNKDGGKSENFSVLAHDFQINALTDAIDHIDFLKIVMEKEIKVKIPVVIVGESIGVKLDGGILVQAMRFIEVKCLPANIPDKVEVDVTNLKIGDSIHVAEINAPSNVAIVSAKEEPVVTISSPTKEEEVAPAAAAAAPTEAQVAEGAQGQAPAAGAPAGAETSPAKPDIKAAPQKSTK